MAFGQDASFADDAFLARYNADLANDLGNLVSRAATMVHRYASGAVPEADPALVARAEEQTLAAAVDRAIAGARDAVLAFRPDVALREIWEAIGATNRYIVAREPWKLAKAAGIQPQ